MADHGLEIVSLSSKTEPIYGGQQQCDYWYLIARKIDKGVVSPGGGAAQMIEPTPIPVPSVGEMFAKTAVSKVEDDEAIKEEMRKTLRSIGIRKDEIDAGINYIIKYDLFSYAASLKSTIEALKMTKISDEITVIVAQDTTGMKESAEDPMRRIAQAIRKNFGESYVSVIAKGPKLLSELDGKIDELANKGRRFALVVSGNNISEERKMELEARVKKVKTYMDGNRSDGLKPKEGLRSPVSAVLNIQGEGHMSITAIQNLSLTIGFGLGESAILACLEKVATVLTADGKSLPPNALADFLRKGYLVLKPICPIDLKEVDEAHRAETAVLISL
jgi:hypothetical protein